jgi:hypothetical protein
MFDGVPPLAGLADHQAGAVSRAQLLASGMTDSQIDAQLNARRWQRIYPGVFVTFTGPLPELTRIWCAVLYAGDGAVASYRTAAWLQGIEDALPSVVEVPYQPAGGCNASADWSCTAAATWPGGPTPPDVLRRLG